MDSETDMIIELQVAPDVAVFDKGDERRCCWSTFGSRPLGTTAFCQCPRCSVWEHRPAVLGIYTCHRCGCVYFLAVEGRPPWTERSQADLERDWAALGAAGAGDELPHVGPDADLVVGASASADEDLDGPITPRQSLPPVDHYTNAMDPLVTTRARQPLSVDDAVAFTREFVRIGNLSEFVAAVGALPIRMYMKTPEAAAQVLAEAAAPPEWCAWASYGLPGGRQLKS